MFAFIKMQNKMQKSIDDLRVSIDQFSTKNAIQNWRATGQLMSHPGTIFISLAFSQCEGDFIRTCNQGIPGSQTVIWLLVHRDFDQSEGA